MDAFLSVQGIAARWGLSVDKVSRILEGFRGEDGFYDFGRSADDTKRHVRKYSVIRIAPELLTKIEAGMR